TALREAPPAPEPPRSLHARLMEMAAVASPAGVREPDSAQSPTFRDARRIGWRAARIGWRMSRTHHRHEPRGSTMANMTTNKKALVTAVAVAIVAVAVGVAYMGDMFPHGANEMAAATIAPAHRYEASQVSSGDLQLGNQDAAKFVQTDVYQKIINDPAMLTLLRSDAFRNALANSEMRTALSNSDALRTALERSDAFRASLQNSDAFRAALEHNDAFRNALANNDALRASLQHNAAFLSAMQRNAAFRNALQSSDAFRSALEHNDAFLQALARNDAFRASLQ